MTVEFVLVVAALTYASRAAALVFLSPPSDRVRRMFDRIPAPLFAGLAAISMLEADGSPVPAPVVAAAAGALIATPSRSLIVILIVGLVAFRVAAWVA